MTAFLPELLRFVILIWLIISIFDYLMTIYLVVDADLDVFESLQKSKEIMKGHKKDYIKFVISTYTSTGYVSMYIIAIIVTIAVGLIVAFVSPSFGGLLIFGATASIFDVVLTLMSLYIAPMIIVGSAMFYDKVMEINTESNQPKNIKFRVINKDNETSKNVAVDNDANLNKSLVIDPYQLLNKPEEQEKYNKLQGITKNDLVSNDKKSEETKMSSKFEKLVNFDPTGGFDKNMMNDGINTSTTYGNMGTIGNVKEQIKKHELENQVNEKAELPNEDEKNISNLDKTENKNSNTKSNDGKLHILGE